MRNPIHQRNRQRPKPEPKVLEVLDGIHLVSQRVIETRSIKVIMMGVEDHDEIHFAIDDTTMRPVEITCYDPLLCLYHYSFDLPGHVGKVPTSCTRERNDKSR